MNRRNFLKNSAVLGLPFISPASMLSSFMKKQSQYGVQLYTVRDEMDVDANSTLAVVSRIGYQKVELAGYANGRFYGHKVADFKQFLSANKLSAPSGHYGTGFDDPSRGGTISNDWERAVADAVEIGHEFMVIGYLHEGERQNLDDYKRHAAQFNKAAELCKTYGIQFAYHNHAFEFEVFQPGEPMPYDVLLKETDADLVKFELDFYWVRLGQQDEQALFAANPGRFPLWHVKDMDATSEQYFTEVGNGIIDYPSIFELKEAAGMQHFFVEQDHCRNHKPLQSIRISHDYLRGAKL